MNRAEKYSNPHPIGRSRELEIGPAAQHSGLCELRSGERDWVQRAASRDPDKEYEGEYAYKKPRIMHFHRGIVSNFSEKSLKLFADNSRIAPREPRAARSHDERVGAFARNENDIARPRHS